MASTPRRRLSAVHRLKRDLESVIEAAAAAAAHPSPSALSDRSNAPELRTPEPSNGPAATTPQCTPRAVPILSPALFVPASSVAPVKTQTPLLPMTSEAPKSRTPLASVPERKHGHQREASRLVALTAERVHTTVQLALTQLSSSDVVGTIGAAPTGARLASVKARLSEVLFELEQLASYQPDDAAASTGSASPLSSTAARRADVLAATATTTPQPTTRPSGVAAPSPPTPSYGETGVAACRLQSIWRGRSARRGVATWLGAPASADAGATEVGGSEPEWAGAGLAAATGAMRASATEAAAERGGRHVGSAPRRRPSGGGRTLHAMRARGRAAHELLASERQYSEQLHTLVSVFLLPLERHGARAIPLAGLLAHVQVLRNLSRMLLAQLTAAASMPLPPSAAAAATLLQLLPAHKVYATYVAGLTPAQHALSALRASDASVQALLTAAEESTGVRLGALILAPLRRLPEYGMAMERMLSLTPLHAPERSQFCRALGSVHELCEVVEASLADHRSRARVAELASQLAPALEAHAATAAADDGGTAPLIEGLSVRHRRYVSEGLLDELCVDEPRPAVRRYAVLFNDILLLLTPEAEGAARRVHEVISLAKVQVRVLPEGGAAGGSAFELWSMARIWRYAASSEAARAEWVQLLQRQVRCLLGAFKQRGQSLAFLPQNVAALRAQLQALTQQKQEVEQRVLQLTTQLCTLDEQAQRDRMRLTALRRRARRSSVVKMSEPGRPPPRGSVSWATRATAAAAAAAAAAVGSVPAAQPSGDSEHARTAAAPPPRLSAVELQELEELQAALNVNEASKAELQATADECVETLFELCHALEVLDEQHNDDSLLQFMLFSSA